MFNIRIAVITTLLTFSSTSFAGDVDLPAQTVKKVKTGWGGEGIYLEFNEGHAPAGCLSKCFFIDRENNHLFSEMLSMVLSAYHAKSKVVVRGNCDSNVNNAVNVTAVDLI